MSPRGNERMIAMTEKTLREIEPMLEEKLAQGGVFLSVPGNTMTIGWGGAARCFNKPCLQVVVRKSRYTWPILEQARCFTVSIPLHDMKAELAFAGTQSGRDVNKFAGHGLTAEPGRAVDAPIVAECELHVECVVRAAFDMRESGTDAAVLDRWYPDRDMHTLYLGEVVACYEK